MLAAHVLSGKGKHGFDDKHRGQLMTLTGMNPTTTDSSIPWLTTATTIAGPMLLSGEEIARAASEALGSSMKFEDISEYVHLQC